MGESTTCVDCDATVAVRPRPPAEPRCIQCANYHMAKREVLKLREQRKELRSRLATLEAENEQLKATDKRLRGDLHRKLGNQIGPEIFKAKYLLCSSCSGKGTGLTCGDCDAGVAEERDTLRSRITTLEAKNARLKEDGDTLETENIGLLQCNHQRSDALTTLEAKNEKLKADAHADFIFMEALKAKYDQGLIALTAERERVGRRDDALRVIAAADNLIEAKWAANRVINAAEEPDDDS